LALFSPNDDHRFFFRSAVSGGPLCLVSPLFFFLSKDIFQIFEEDSLPVSFSRIILIPMPLSASFLSCIFFSNSR